MLARVLIIVAVNAAFFAAVLWLIPIQGLLEARGYTPAQIEALASAGQADDTTDADKSDATPNTGGTKTETGDRDTTADSGPAPDAGSEAETSASDGASGASDAAASPDQKNASGGDAAPRPELAATDTVNVRAGQGTDHGVVGQVTNGDVVTVLENPGDDWVRIKHHDVRGWAYRPLFESQDAQ